MVVETAAKSSEIMRLRWDAVDFKSRTVHFEVDKATDARTLPISMELIECLAKKRHDAEVVFTNLAGRPFVTKRQFTNVLADFKRRHGIPEKWMYRDLRHSFAVNFLASGGELKRLQKILGHRAFHTTQEIYGKYCATSSIEVGSPFES